VVISLTLPSWAAHRSRSDEITGATRCTVQRSWLRYEYDGLNLLRIDERYDGDDPPDGLDENDPWRPLNVFIHGPGAIGQIVKGKWYNYYSDGQNPTSCCDSGEYYYFYDALGNVNTGAWASASSFSGRLS